MRKREDPRIEEIRLQKTMISVLGFYESRPKYSISIGEIPFIIFVSLKLLESPYKFLLVVHFIPGVIRRCEFTDFQLRTAKLNQIWSLL